MILAEWSAFQQLSGAIQLVPRMRVARSLVHQVISRQA